MDNNLEIASNLDIRGKCCPMPMIETINAMEKLSQGEVLRVIASDPGSQLDIASWCKRTGHQLLASLKEDDSFIYKIKKS